MIKFYNLSKLFSGSSYTNKINFLAPKNKQVLNLTKRYFFKKSNALDLAAEKKDYYSNYKCSTYLIYRNFGGIEEC